MERAHLAPYHQRVGRGATEPRSRTGYGPLYGRHPQHRGPEVEVTAGGTRIERHRRNGMLHRERWPAVIEQSPDGTRREIYYLHGEVSRPHGPAVIERRADGTTIRSYYENGQLHRDTGRGPAQIMVKADGSRTERYYHRGELQRDDGGPQVIETVAGRSTWKRRVESYYRDGVRFHAKLFWPDGTESERYFDEFGSVHRDDGPAELTMSPDGSRTEKYMSAGEWHRLGGPAITDRRADGTIAGEDWYCEGQLHREDGGPARVRVNERGDMQMEWWIRGERRRRTGEPTVTITLADGTADRP